jgi:hypothetical protein
LKEEKFELSTKMVKRMEFVRDLLRFLWIAGGYFAVRHSFERVVIHNFHAALA